MAYLYPRILIDSIRDYLHPNQDVIDAMIVGARFSCQAVIIQGSTSGARDRALDDTSVLCSVHMALKMVNYHLWVAVQ